MNATTMVFPNEFVLLNQNDMMYVEGGDRDLLYEIEAADCTTIAQFASAGAVTSSQIGAKIAAVTGFIPASIATIAVAALAISATVFFNRAAARGGAGIYDVHYDGGGGTVNPGLSTGGYVLDYL